MRFKKLQATQLFDGYRFRENEVLVLKEDGTVEAIIAPESAGEDVLPLQGILSPGFINCHCHLELSHLKDQISENTGLADFVRQVVQKRNVPEDAVFQAIVDAEAEMIDNGIVATGDICNTPHTLPQKQKGNLYYYNFIEVLGADPLVADKNFSFYQNVYQEFADVSPRRASIAPHAPYSVSEPLWQKILGHDKNGLFTIHNQETEDETRWFMQKTGGFADMFKAMGIHTDGFAASGKSSLQTYLPKFTPGKQLLLVHNVFTSEEDIQVAESAHPHLYWCFCPNANYYISRLLPNLPIFIQNGVKIVLGTDSLASNHQLCIWEEIQTLQAAFPAIPLEQMLQWATINGAKALKADAQYGSFEKGKKPGLVLISGQKAKKIRIGN